MAMLLSWSAEEKYEVIISYIYEGISGGNWLKIC